jgi:NADH-quinone oxidoreductase subunit D
MSPSDPADRFLAEGPGGSTDLRELTTLNLGPTHPATHGIFQNVLTLDGEIIQSAEQTIGYIHRAFEKIAERRPFYQITTLTDRMNYCSAPINNMGWHMTWRSCCGIELPKRVEYMRVIVMELARIADHIICNTIVIGRIPGRSRASPTSSSGARRSTRSTRRSAAHGSPPTWVASAASSATSAPCWERDPRHREDLPAALKEFDNLLVRNRIFMDRTVNCGPLSADRALAYGFTGPNLRACGVDHDVRVADPYSSYEDFDFIIPVGQSGDTYDRFMVRHQEMWESLSIIKQAMDKLDG